MKTVEEKANEHVNKYDISTIENKTWYRMVMKECFITGHQSALDDASGGYYEFVRDISIEELNEGRAAKDYNDPNSMPFKIWKASALYHMKKIQELEKELELRSSWTKHHQASVSNALAEKGKTARAALNKLKELRGEK